MGRHSLQEQPKRGLQVRDRRVQQARENRHSWALIGGTALTFAVLGVSSVFLAAEDTAVRVPLALAPGPQAAPVTVIDGAAHRTKPTARFAFEPDTDVTDVVHAVPIPPAPVTAEPPRVQSVDAHQGAASDWDGHSQTTTHSSPTTTARPVHRQAPSKQRARELVKHIVERISKHRASTGHDADDHEHGGHEHGGDGRHESHQADHGSSSSGGHDSSGEDSGDE